MENANEQQGFDKDSAATSLRTKIDHLASIASKHWREATEKAYEIEHEIHKLEAQLEAQAA